MLFLKSALKEKQKQEQRLLVSQTNIVIADFLANISNLTNEGIISPENFAIIKTTALMCENTRIAVSEIEKELKYWSLLLELGLVDAGTICEGIKCIVTDSQKLPPLISKDCSLQYIIKELYNAGCRVVSKDYSRRKIVIVMAKPPYTLTITKYKTFFLSTWKKKLEISEADKKCRIVTIGEACKLLQKV